MRWKHITVWLSYGERMSISCNASKTSAKISFIMLSQKEAIIDEEYYQSV
jgi:hypothetical protein